MKLEKVEVICGEVRRKLRGRKALLTLVMTMFLMQLFGLSSRVSLSSSQQAILLSSLAQSDVSPEMEAAQNCLPRIK